MVRLTKGVVVLSVFATSLFGCAAPAGSGSAGKMHIRPQPKTQTPSQPADNGVTPVPTTQFGRCVAGLTANVRKCREAFMNDTPARETCFRGGELWFTSCLGF